MKRVKLCKVCALNLFKINNIPRSSLGKPRNKRFIHQNSFFVYVKSRKIKKKLSFRKFSSFFFKFKIILSERQRKEQRLKVGTRQTDRQEKEEKYRSFVFECIKLNNYYFFFQKLVANRLWLTKLMQIFNIMLKFSLSCVNFFKKEKKG